MESLNTPAVVSTPHWIDNEGPFESLPPEIIAKIVKMAMKSEFDSGGSEGVSSWALLA